MPRRMVPARPPATPRRRMAPARQGRRTVLLENRREKLEEETKQDRLAWGPARVRIQALVPVLEVVREKGPRAVRGRVQVQGRRAGRAQVRVRVLGAGRARAPERELFPASASQAAAGVPE
jgi:hypothetical protein